MDLSELDTTDLSESGTEMQLRHPVTGAVLLQDDGTPITITLAGMDSERFRKIQREQQERRAAEQPRKVVTIDDIEKDQIDLLVACTIKWSGMKANGELLDSVNNNFKAVYKRFKWIREQVDAYIANRKNYLPVSATNS